MKIEEKIEPLFVNQSEEFHSIIRIFGKDLPVYKRGKGALPLLILGPATLFKKPGLIPSSLDEHFTIYFLDFFSKLEQKDPMSYENFLLDNFVFAVEQTRTQLKLDKMVLFAHSAAGVLAVEYSIKYPKNVLFNILICASPIWGKLIRDLSSCFFKLNADDDRKKLFEEDQNLLKTDAEVALNAKEARTSFIRNYNARRAYFYQEPKQPFWQNLWDGVNLDEELVKKYFSLIQDFDIRKKNYNIPTFLSLGLYDYSCPFYIWTEDAKSAMQSVDYRIFESSGHYPMWEQSQGFTEKLLEYINKNCFSKFSDTEVCKL